LGDGAFLEAVGKCVNTSIGHSPRALILC
jgi:hypothetical protein